MTISEELKTTIRSSTLKGVPRILSSQSTVQKILWSFGVLIFLSICAQQVYTIVSEYLLYDTIFNINKDYFVSTNGAPEELFPQIVLCSKNTINKELKSVDFHNLGVFTPNEYVEYVSVFTQCKNCTEAEELYMHSAQGYLLTKKSYYQYVEKPIAEMVGQIFEDFIINCEVIITISTLTYSQPCDSYITAHSIVHPEYFNCFVFKTKQIKEISIVGIKFTLHIDNRFDDLNTYSDEGIGALVSLIPEGHPEVVDINSINAPVGFETTIPFTIVKTTLLPDPYGECITDLNETYMNNLNYTYTSQLCLAECTRYHIEQLCNCSDSLTLNYPEPDGKTSGYCGALKGVSRKEIMQKMKCLLKTYVSVAERCSDTCLKACHEFYYETKVSMSKWPPSAYLGQFYMDFIDKKRINKRFQSYKDVYNAISNGTGSKYTIEQKQAALNLVEDNFARVYIHSGTKYLYQYTERPKVSTASFLSQLGGTLNLWAGITVVVFIEIIDFMLRLTVLNKDEQIKKSPVSVIPVSSFK